MDWLGIGMDIPRLSIRIQASPENEQINHAPQVPRSLNGFRSKGEVQIARLLERNGIRYLYEQPVAVVEDGKTRIWYPDFLLPDFGVLIEYCGRADDPDYAAGMVRKQGVYSQNGLAALFVLSEDLRGDWPNRILSQIESELAHRVHDFRDSVREAHAGRVRQERDRGLTTYI